jgi:hypothetical protein
MYSMQLEDAFGLIVPIWPLLFCRYLALDESKREEDNSVSGPEPRIYSNLKVYNHNVKYEGA